MKKNMGILIILLAVMGGTALLDHKFFQPFNIMNIARWTGMYGIMTIGEAFVIITGGIDLSVGSVVGLIGTLLPMMLQTGLAHHLPITMVLPAVLLILLAIAVLIGLAHGLLITKLKLQPFVVTLCGLFIYRGLARYIAGDDTQGFGSGFTGLRYLAQGAPFNIPMPFLLFIGVALLAAVLLNKTIYGRYLLALGNNEQAARYSGVSTDRMIVMAYVISAVCAAFSSVLFALDLNSVQPSGHGNFFELYAIAGAVLGGCSLRGGEGSILGVVIGTAIVRVLYNAINILGIPTQLEFAVIGFVILIGVMADELVRRYAARRRVAQQRHKEISDCGLRIAD